MNNVMVNSCSIGYIGEPEQKIFRTALLGFKRDDVLSYVEKISRENSVAAQELHSQIAQLEAGLSQKTSDNESLSERVKALDISLFEEKSRADNAEELVGALRLEADRANDEATAYKSRLFAKEQESVVLKADNARLNQTITSLTVTITEYDAQRDEPERIKLDALSQAKAVREQALRDAEGIKAAATAHCNQMTQAASIKAKELREKADAAKTDFEIQAIISKQKAESEAKLIRSNASNDAVALVSAAEKEKLAAKQLVSGSAQSIANSIVVLKAELEAVDKRINSAVCELTTLTNGISGALVETEKNLQTLGVQIDKFPSPARAVSPIRTHILPKRNTVAETILEKLTKLLKA